MNAARRNGDRRRQRPLLGKDPAFCYVIGIATGVLFGYVMHELGVFA